MIIENKEMKPLKEMADEEIAAIVLGKPKGEVERWDTIYDDWYPAGKSYTITESSVYRIVPKYTPITVDWSVLDDRFQWIAAGKNGEIYTHEVKPKCFSGYWDFGGAYRRIDGLIKSLNRGDIPWEQSLIKRPEGV